MTLALLLAGAVPTSPLPALSAADALGRGDPSRGAAGAILAAGAAGYALGPRYARRTPYSVTSGDVRLLGLGGGLGMMGR